MDKARTFIHYILVSVFSVAIAWAILLANLSFALAEDKLEVDDSIDELEQFERVVLGRGLRADWAHAPLELISDGRINIRIVVELPLGRKNGTEENLKSAAFKLVGVARATTGLEITESTEIIVTDAISTWCNRLDSVETKANQQGNSLLVLIGAKVEECLSSSHFRQKFGPQNSISEVSDPDLFDRGFLTCLSRQAALSSNSNVSETGPDRKYKEMMIATSLEGNQQDFNRLQFCFFDRAFSFLGFRGRLVFSEESASSARRKFESLRTVPFFSPIPSTSDLLMLAVAYRNLANDSNYERARDRIRRMMSALE